MLLPYEADAQARADPRRGLDPPILILLLVPDWTSL